MEKEKMLSRWKKKRQATTVLAMIHASLVGLEYTAVTISALYYLQNILHVQQAHIFYGLTVGSMFISSVISNIILGRYMDKMRNGRKIIIGSVLLAIFGNILYSLPYSPWLLVVGRFLCGFSDATIAVMTGEFTRCYEQKELNSVITKHSTVYAFSFALGPCTPLLLQWIHYNNWPIILDQSNCIGILLMIIQTVFLIFVYFSFSNLSEEPGYDIFVELKEKEMPPKGPNNECSKMKNLSLEETKQNKLKRKKEMVTIKDLLTNSSIALVFFGSAFTNSLSAVIDLLVNIVCLDTLKWTVNNIGMATGAAMALNAAISIVTYSRFLNNARNVFFFNLTLIVMAWLNMCVLIIINEHYIHLFSIEMVVVILLLFANMYSGPTSSVTGRIMLFSLVPSHSSSGCEGARIAFSRAMIGFAYFIAPIIYLQMVYIFTGFLVVILAIYICYVIKRDVFY